MVLVRHLGAVRLPALALHLHGHQGRQDGAHAVPQRGTARGAAVPRPRRPRAGAPGPRRAARGLRPLRPLPAQRGPHVGREPARGTRGEVLPRGRDEYGGRGSQVPQPRRVHHHPEPVAALAVAPAVLPLPAPAAPSSAPRPSVPSRPSCPSRISRPTKGFPASNEMQKGGVK